MYPGLIGSYFRMSVSGCGSQLLGFSSSSNTSSAGGADGSTMFKSWSKSDTEFRHDGMPSWISSCTRYWPWTRIRRRLLQVHVVASVRHTVCWINVHCTYALTAYSVTKSNNLRIRKPSFIILWPIRKHFVINSDWCNVVRSRPILQHLHAVIHILYVEQCVMTYVHTWSAVFWWWCRAVVDVEIVHLVLHVSSHTCWLIPTLPLLIQCRRRRVRVAARARFRVTCATNLLLPVGLKSTNHASYWSFNSSAAKIKQIPSNVIKNDAIHTRKLVQEALTVITNSYMRVLSKHTQKSGELNHPDGYIPECAVT